MSAPFELDGFEPISRLGGGGFGDVWLAKQTNVDRDVAIKIGHSAIEDETIRLRFDRECKALGRLSGHPHIVDVYTAGSLNDGRPYLVLEYINGGTLWQRLKESPIPENELRRFGTELAGALDVAHSSGVLHRDLKPENILMRTGGETVLGDFGIARLHDGQKTTSAAITASVAYAAPEILSGKPATVSSDLYGIGVCLLAAVFRSVPFVQKTDESIHPIISRVLSDNPPDCRRHGVSEGLATIVDSLLSKDPGQRPSSASEVLASFKALPPISTGPAVTPDSAQAPATQIVSTNPNAPVVQQPVQPQAAAMPAAPQQVAPQQVGPANQPQFAQIPNQNIRSTDVPAPQLLQKQPNNHVRLFILAYLATLIIGGVIIFAITQLTNDDPQPVETQGLADRSESPLETATSLPAETTDEADDSTGEPADSNAQASPLQIPLALEDTALPEGTETFSNDDLSSPGSSTLCDDAPATDGLVEWEGVTFSADQGIREFRQIVSRFETAEDAQAYLEDYERISSCGSWSITDDDGEQTVFEISQTDPPQLGDNGKRFEIEAAAIANLSIHFRILLIQSDTDVLILTANALSEPQVDELEALAPLAAERLGYSIG